MEKSEMEEYNNVQPPNISKYSDGYLNIDEVSLCAAEHTHTHSHTRFDDLSEFDILCKCATGELNAIHWNAFIFKVTKIVHHIQINE